MNTPRKITLAILILTTLAAFSGAVEADTYDHIDKLAKKLQKQTRELRQEFGRHYRHVDHATHLRSDALEIYKLSKHIHQVAHNEGSVVHLRNDLKNAERFFHHLEAALAASNRSFFGHVHGRARHVHELMHEVEETLHHLNDDMNVLARSQRSHHGLELSRHARHHSSRVRRSGFGVGWERSGIVFGNRNFVIRIGR
jgi:hypothetical protein